MMMAIDALKLEKENGLVNVKGLQLLGQVEGYV
jgi:hypothetical protein